MNQSEYARHRGVTRKMVSAWIHSGHLDGNFKKTGVRNYDIDPVKADAALEQNLSPAHRKKGKPPSTDASYLASRAKKEAALAEMRRLEVEERKGNLIAKKQVEREAFETGRRVRDALMGIPNRVAAQLAVTTDQKVCAKTLAAEIRQALEGLTE